MARVYHWNLWDIMSLQLSNQYQITSNQVLREIVFTAPFECEYNGSKPDEIIHIPPEMINEAKIKKWFENNRRHIGQELTSDKIVWLALTEGGFPDDLEIRRKLHVSRYGMCCDIVKAVKKTVN